MAERERLRAALGMSIEMMPIPADQMMASPGPLETANYSPNLEGAKTIADKVLSRLIDWLEDESIRVNNRAIGKPEQEWRAASRQAGRLSVAAEELRRITRAIPEPPDAGAEES